MGRDPVDASAEDESAVLRGTNIRRISEFGVGGKGITKLDLGFLFFVVRHDDHRPGPIRCALAIPAVELDVELGVVPLGVENLAADLCGVAGLLFGGVEVRGDDGGLGGA